MSKRSFLFLLPADSTWCAFVIGPCLEALQTFTLISINCSFTVMWHKITTHIYFGCFGMSAFIIILFNIWHCNRLVALSYGPLTEMVHKEGNISLSPTHSFCQTTVSVKTWVSWKVNWLNMHSFPVILYIPLSGISFWEKWAFNQHNTNFNTIQSLIVIYIRKNRDFVSLLPNRKIQLVVFQTMPSRLNFSTKRQKRKLF